MKDCLKVGLIASAFIGLTVLSCCSGYGQELDFSPLQEEVKYLDFSPLPEVSHVAMLNPRSSVGPNVPVALVPTRHDLGTHDVGIFRSCGPAGCGISQAPQVQMKYTPQVQVYQGQIQAKNYRSQPRRWGGWRLFSRWRW